MHAVPLELGRAPQPAERFAPGPSASTSGRSALSCWASSNAGIDPCPPLPAASLGLRAGRAGPRGEQPRGRPAAARRSRRRAAHPPRLEGVPAGPHPRACCRVAFAGPSARRRRTRWQQPAASTSTSRSSRPTCSPSCRRSAGRATPRCRARRRRSATASPRSGGTGSRSCTSPASSTKRLSGPRRRRGVRAGHCPVPGGQGDAAIPARRTRALRAHRPGRPPARRPAGPIRPGCARLPDRQRKANSGGSATTTTAAHRAKTGR
jgi:hypothetical protein